MAFYIMSLFHAIVLAIVQGITEFLPISSSAHLALAPWLLGWPDQGLAFDIALHVGTLLAVIAYFLRDWVQLIASGFGLRTNTRPDLAANSRLLWLVVAATIPAAVAGVLLKHTVETTLRSPFVSGTMLVVFSGIMAAAERYGRHYRPISSISPGDALFIGTAQAIALVPGVSRSGSTISAGLFRHLERAAAARFSFLLSTPVIAGAAVKAAYDLHKTGGLAPDMRLPVTVGIITSAITGWLVIAFLLNYLKHRSLKLFIYYRLIFGIIVIALAMLRA